MLLVTTCYRPSYKAEKPLSRGLSELDVVVVHVVLDHPLATGEPLDDLADLPSTGIPEADFQLSALTARF